MNDEATFVIRTSSAGGAHVVSVGGEVDLMARGALEDAVNPGRPADAIVIDLSKATFVDSSGFRVIHAASTSHRVLLVVPAESRVARAVAVSGLSELVQICGTLDEAIATTAASSAPAGPDHPPRP